MVMQGYGGWQTNSWWMGKKLPVTSVASPVNLWWRTAQRALSGYVTRWSRGTTLNA